MNSLLLQKASVCASHDTVHLLPRFKENLCKTTQTTRSDSIHHGNARVWRSTAKMLLAITMPPALGRKLKMAASK